MVISHGPEKVDDKDYKKSPSLEYQLRVTNTGHAVTHVNVSEDIVSLVKAYTQIAESLPQLDMNQLEIAYTELDDINFRISRQVKLELENNDITSINNLLEDVEHNKIALSAAKPVVKNIVDVAIFHTKQTHSNSALLNKIESLKAVLQ